MAWPNADTYPQLSGPTSDYSLNAPQAGVLDPEQMVEHVRNFFGSIVAPSYNPYTNPNPPAPSAAASNAKVAAMKVARANSNYSNEGRQPVNASVSPATILPPLTRDLSDANNIITRTGNSYTGQ